MQSPVLFIISMTCRHWRSQLDNLVPLWKFQIIIIILIIFLEIVVFRVSEHENVCIAGLNRRAGYATSSLQNT